MLDYWQEKLIYEKSFKFFVLLLSSLAGVEGHKDAEITLLRFTERESEFVNFEL